MTAARTSRPFLSLISAAEAYAIVGGFEPLPTETIAWQQALERVLAETVRAQADVPHFARSNMDGYAVRAEDTHRASELSSVALRLTGEVAMGEAAAVDLAPGCAVRVSTGAMMPAGADAVVIVEHCHEADDNVLVRAPVTIGQNVIGVGEELREHEVVLRAGRRLRPADLGALSVAGATDVRVYRRPRAGIIVTGDEIIDPGIELQPGQVRNVNQFVLRAAAAKAHAEVRDYGVIGDDPDDFARTLSRAVSECDVAFLSGGSSKGHKDLTLSSIEALPGGEVLFHGIAIAPGKPTILARAGDCLLMGLPGNPAAAAVVFYLFGATLVRVLGGEKLDAIFRNRPRVRTVLAEDVSSTQGREEYLRVRLESATASPEPSGDGCVDELPLAVPQRGKSAAITTVARADALVAIAASSEGLRAGTVVDAWLLM